MSRLSLLPVAAFSDNYIWLLHDGQTALAVDPGNAAPLEAALAAHRLALAGILVTHHHPDHVGGLAALRRERPGLRVIGPASEAIDGLTERVHGGQSVQLLGQQLRVLDVPGHTAGHLAYVIDGPSDGSAPLLFCGDTLFAAGCGRLFEGTPAQMHHSLSKLTALPADTRVCCTHEYTLSNLRFAAAVEPGNRARADYDARCQALRAEGQPTLPSRIGLERQVNPFLRCTEPEVMAAARAQGAAGDDAVSVLAALREWKNGYR